MAYLALYREWRPRVFKDIVGQEHITKTLINALKQQKIAHAYLFSGPRGTGKTTAAKILAKALNCEELQGVEPCNHCPSCTGIDHGSSMEVFEIDAASNRGIGEIRDLRENIKLSSTQGKYKVYIIDEVHMLTSEAFNALLKTLEEPPQQVIFILATTEVQKIPLTILSRVQRFEFHRISLENIQKRLLEVCTSIERQVNPDALAVIAQKSEGGLRDALSILDQCLLQDDPIGVEEVYLVLGMVGETYSAQLVEACLFSDYGKSLNLLADGIQQGRDPRQIIRELLDYLRQMLLTASTGKTPMVAPHIQDRLVKQAATIGIPRLLRWISVLLQGEGQLKYASNARLAAELLLVQTIHDSQPSTMDGQEEILKRLYLIEQQLQGGGFVREGIPEGKPLVSSKSSRVIPKDPPQAQKISHTEVKTSDSGNTAEESKLSLTIEGIQERWNDVLEQVKKLKKSTQAFLMEGKPVQLDGKTLTILFREGCSFHKDKVNQAENRQTIEDVLKRLFGTSLTLQNFMENEFQTKETPSSQDSKKQEQALINKARDMFGSDLVVVRE
ncbi:DNA polymerase III subunit gamma/tau [Desulfosporosinus sp. BICA1-9]|uniref:DNA polymerase III subunit gamma/tau n=1 Tax=Desulfosporosinus sp. BICA1-9 TaxID=1531958 RepID=UPI00054B330E|nr:DNA polymerase III subunit gamma/tau [Desulfosporosinus sp. BICA1-9]KJS48284.1 MAG: DNA polymerase III subunit gamma/tau [Peptococcaceae bacterium BRH_c23]KJS89636.1 MAG: DNA polymerase III subunit gamma/tau [Desulfosporosinus sp. BICA1-9]HBW39177.1 DNA polymerase III subunit gamma/tau [Desulfosporosinus sp.]